MVRHIEAATSTEEHTEWREKLELSDMYNVDDLTAQDCQACCGLTKTATRCLSKPTIANGVKNDQNEFALDSMCTVQVSMPSTPLVTPFYTLTPLSPLYYHHQLTSRSCYRSPGSTSVKCESVVTESKVGLCSVINSILFIVSSRANTCPLSTSLVEECVYSRLQCLLLLHCVHSPSPQCKPRSVLQLKQREIGRSGVTSE
jgi:hypothetical protein